MNKKDERIFELSKQIRLCKMQLGLNHTDMAAMLGYSRDSYIKWYEGIRMPKEDTYQELLVKLEQAIS